MSVWDITELDTADVMAAIYNKAVERSAQPPMTRGEAKRLMSRFRDAGKIGHWGGMDMDWLVVGDIIDTSVCTAEAQEKSVDIDAVLRDLGALDVS